MRRPHCSIVPLLLCLAIILNAAIKSLVSTLSDLQKYFGKTITIAGEISADPVYKKDDWRITLKTDYGDIYVMTNEAINAKRSDKIEVGGLLSEGFGNYVAFLYRPTIKQIVTIDNAAIVLRDAVASNVQASIENKEQSALALSYLTGQKALLSEEQSNNIRLAGLAHVVVASGFHLAIVVGIAKKVFGKISRFATVSVAVILMMIYISVTGLTPSMMRAGLMTTLALVAWYYGRRFHPARLILYVAAISLLIDNSMVTNLAWQLSFASYTGIVFISPVLMKYLYGERRPGYVANLIIISTSAQLACLPLTVYYFGSISGLALVANLLVTPTISVAMLLTFVVGVTLCAPATMLLKGLLSLHIWIINAIASIPWATINLEQYNPAVFFAYPIIILLVIYLKRKTGYSYRPSYAIAKTPDYGIILSC